MFYILYDEHELRIHVNQKFTDLLGYTTGDLVAAWKSGVQFTKLYVRSYTIGSPLTHVIMASKFFLLQWNVNGICTD